jgi:DNA replication protein DnaC
MSQFARPNPALEQTWWACQLPVKAWHTYLDDPTLADAILDRVVHSSHKIELKGKSLRDPKEDA